ncbi:MULTISPECIES: glutathione S-transferase family protein [Rhodomicrobium]|uniref:glutathione S-transferase family protein n=1 Tax=Rhodomicrobium TaxID=1068 RepID=UPI000B4BE552|nr:MULTISPECIES: glutathione S-transferase family protein [Rhodomicrobium]
MKLYFDPLSSSSRAVTFFLYDQGIAFEEVIIDLNLQQHKEASFLALNPSGQVPVLQDGNFILTESSAILRYLAEKTGAAYPPDLKRRARVDETMSWLDTNFRIYYCVFGVYQKTVPEFRGLGPQSRADLARVGEEGTRRFMTVLDRNFLAGMKYVWGDDITIADYLGSALVSLGFIVNFDFSPYPNVRNWLDRLRQRPGWNAANGTYCDLANKVSAGTIGFTRP